MGIIEWLDSTLYYARLGLITAVFGTIAVLAATPAITVNVGQERVVTIPGVDAPVVEPHLSINPRNPNNLIAGAMVAQSDYNYSVIGLSSLDGGLTWYKHEFSAKGAGDVWTAFVADGTAVLSFLAQPDSALQVFRSGDGGRTWSERPATTARGQDHPTLLFGPDGSLYTVSAGYARTKSERARDAIIVTRSADGGASFAGPVSVIASNLLYEAGNPAIAPDGMLLIPFADHHRPGSRRRLQGPRDWMVVSSDGGKTFSEPLLISESCDGRGGWSSLAVFRDRTYHVCPAAELNGIQFRHSENRGETWSEPIRIDHPGDTTPQTRTPAIAVNGEGHIAIAWYDARNDRSTIKGNFRCQEIVVAVSVDGGLTFLPEVQVSSKPSCAATPRNVETALRFPAGGEYMGLAAAPDGSFQLLWSDSRSEMYRLYTAKVAVNEK
ncbi:MAG: hypothetical protein DMG54_35535 [Acidobacteria bacterium]|nr:MAG: hypothetical protein DMG54_35535 [Acidobacteriota bacterium]